MQDNPFTNLNSVLGINQPQQPTTGPFVSPIPTAQPSASTVTATPSSTTPSKSLFSTITDAVSSLAGKIGNLPTGGSKEGLLFPPTINPPTPEQNIKVKELFQPSSYLGGRVGQGIASDIDTAIMALVPEAAPVAGVLKLSPQNFLKGAAIGTGLQAALNTLKGKANNISSLGPAAFLSGIFGLVGPKEGASILEADKAAEAARATVEKTKVVGEKARVVEEGKIMSELLPAGFKERGLVTSVKESPIVSQAVKEIVSGVYKPIVDKEVLAKAAEAIAKDAEAVKKEVFKVNNFNAETAAKEELLALEYDRRGDTASADALWEDLAQKATTAGQGNQVLSYIGALSPHGMERWVQTTLESYNKQRAGILNEWFGVQPINYAGQFKKTIQEQILKIRKTPHASVERDAEIKQLIQIMGENIPPTVSEIFDAYRYNNLLSSPNTWGPLGKNSWFNTAQVLFTRPAELAFKVPVDIIESALTGKEREFYLKQIPDYYKALFNAAPEAAQSFASVLKGESAIERPDLPMGLTKNDMNSLVRSTRMEQIPGMLQIFPRMLEANDRFFQTFLTSSEYSRLRELGRTKEEAMKEAEKVAQYYLGRETPGAKLGKQGFILDIFDNLENLVSKARKFKPVSWLIPFIHVANQLGKMTFEYSPLGYSTMIGNENKSRQFVKATMGTTAALLASLMTADGKVTGPAPNNREDRNLFFASGRKPWSVYFPIVGWVPLAYFGPLGVAMGLGAASRYFTEVSPARFTDSNIKKMGEILGSQLEQFSELPMLSGINNIAKLLNGDIDTTLLSSLVFTAEQAIPLSSFDRYMASLIDPVYRSVTGEGPFGTLKRDIPFASKSLLPFLNPAGEPEKRNITNYAAPYAIGFPNPEYEAQYQELLRIRQEQAISTKLKSTINTIQNRIENIGSDVSLSEDERNRKLDAEQKKIDAAYAEYEKEYAKAEPYLNQPLPNFVPNTNAPSATPTNQPTQTTPFITPTQSPSIYGGR